MYLQKDKGNQFFDRLFKHRKMDLYTFCFEDLFKEIIQKNNLQSSKILKENITDLDERAQYYRKWLEITTLDKIEVVSFPTEKISPSEIIRSEVSFEYKTKIMDDSILEELEANIDDLTKEDLKILFQEKYFIGQKVEEKLGKSTLVFVNLYILSYFLSNQKQTKERFTMKK